MKCLFFRRVPGFRCGCDVHSLERPVGIVDAGEKRFGSQDGWIGTESIVKVDGSYYFFYTGHGDSAALEYKEKILVAVGDSPRSFRKLEGWEIVPPSELGQKNDFRDPPGLL